jgi:hypothetical protein
MPSIDPKNLASFAQGPRPGADELERIDLDEAAADLAAASGQSGEEPEKTDADDKTEFEGPVADFVHALEADVEGVEDLAYELTDDQIDAPTDDPGEDDRNVVLAHIDDGSLDPEIARLAKLAFADGVSMEDAEKIGDHLVEEGMTEDATMIVAYLLVLGAVIGEAEVGEAPESDEDEESEDEEEDEDLEEEEDPLEASAEG